MHTLDRQVEQVAHGGVGHDLVNDVFILIVLRVDGLEESSCPNQGVFTFMSSLFGSCLECVCLTFNLASHAADSSLNGLLLNEVLTSESVIILATRILSVHKSRTIQIRAKAIWNQCVSSLSVAHT